MASGRCWEELRTREQQLAVARPEEDRLVRQHAALEDLRSPVSTHQPSFSSYITEDDGTRLVTHLFSLLTAPACQRHTISNVPCREG